MAAKQKIHEFPRIDTNNKPFVKIRENSWIIPIRSELVT